MRAHLPLAALTAVASVTLAAAQPTSVSPLAPPPNSVRRTEPAAGHAAFTNATIHISPSQTLDLATLTIKGGLIESVTSSNKLDPTSPSIRDCSSFHIYPAFIEPYLEVEVPAPSVDAPGAHWNPRITPQRNALDAARRGRTLDDATLRSLRDLGFAAAAISPRSGILRGQSAVVSLAPSSADPSAEGPRVYREYAYQAASLETSFRPEATLEETPDTARWTSYPGSQMGAIALLRQTFSDAAWQQRGRWDGDFTGPPNALDSIAQPQVAGAPEGAAIIRRAPQGWDGRILFDTADELEALRCAKLAAEFHRPAAILGSGQEYQRLDAIIATGLPLILPLTTPRPPQVATLGEQNAAELDELMHWEQAPTNARRVDASLRDAGSDRAADVSLTTSKLESRAAGGRRGGAGGTGAGAAGSSDDSSRGSRAAFADALNKALKHGLPADRAFAMLTINPAKLLGVDHQLGTLEQGKVASFIIADGPLFTARPDAPKKDEPGHIRPGRIVSVWIDGREHVVRTLPSLRVGGHYEVTLTPPPPGDVKISFDIDDSGAPERPDLRITRLTRTEDGKEDSAEITVSDLSIRGTTFSFSFEHEPFGEKGVFVNSGVIERAADGAVLLRAGAARASGRQFNWVATRTGPSVPRKRSLAGAWPVIFDPAVGGHPILSFDRGNILTPIPSTGVRTVVEGKPLTIDNFQYDGTKLSYDFDQSQVIGPDGQPLKGIARTDATIDWTANPPRMIGFVTAPAEAGGAKVNFTALRRARNPFTGDWRITQAGGVPKEANPPPDGLMISIKGGGTGMGAGSGGGGRRGGRLRGDGGNAPGEPATTPAADSESGIGRPTVRLIFAAKGRPPVEIDASDVSFRGGKLYFKHSFAPLGLEGESTDQLTIAWDKDDPAKDILIGLGRMPDGAAHPYQAVRVPDLDGKKETAAIAAIPTKLGLPFGGFALDAQPSQDKLLITNATLWTCKDGTSDTVVTDGALVIADGKIQYAGPSASLPRLTDGYTTIDAKGKFVTPGIIDCHSHTGISRGVNEGGQAVTAEVRIGDVTNPDDVSWYRQLAGGVTCVNNLHGSANAIGGQSMVNKVRWGCTHPDDMHFEQDMSALRADSANSSIRGSLPGIKFALGENPRQANSSRPDRERVRYPQTRMGVEGLIRDRFTAAREYLAARAASGSSSLPPRRDLELEALAEVLEGKRLIHCHSYRQDEILMLCRVAQDFGFKVGTFQHILEGYKVADEMVKWSGGGSAFSDWWAYKVEVQDAIPFAGPLMAEQGVVVSYNSDSDEMARRMNVEAGKAAKYSRGNKAPIPPHEAFKFVTLNPAKQLKIDAFTGSLESGKDADIAVWSDVPTNATARCEMTFVDGRKVFSLDDDRKHRDHIAAERARLIQKVLASSDRSRVRGEDDDSPDTSESTESDLPLADLASAPRRLLLLESLRAADDYRRELYLALLRRGLDPRWTRAGECGCED